MSARTYTPRFAVADVPHTSTHLLKLTMTRLVEQDRCYQLGNPTASERAAFEAAAEYITAIDGELHAREIAGC